MRPRSVAPLAERPSHIQMATLAIPRPHRTHPHVVANAEVAAECAAVAASCDTCQPSAAHIAVAVAHM
eukprot:2986766-Karenia_brevis.AAC.1